MGRLLFVHSSIWILEYLNHFFYVSHIASSSRFMDMKFDFKFLLILLVNMWIIDFGLLVRFIWIPCLMLLIFYLGPHFLLLRFCIWWLWHYNTASPLLPMAMPRLFTIVVVIWCRLWFCWGILFRFYCGILQIMILLRNSVILVLMFCSCKSYFG